MDYYIYLTTNLVNNKKYIGQHKGKPDDNYFGSGTTIMKALKKYGKENFKKDILCFCETREEADKKEREYIKLYNAVEDKMFYNNQEGGKSADGWRACHRWFKTHPEEAQQFYKRNGERLQQWRIDHPEEFQDKAVKPFEEGAKKYWNAHPEERKKCIEKMNENLDKWRKNHPEEYQAQIDNWRRAGNEANSQRVLCITTGKEFESLSAAARYYNIAQPNISKCLKGERQSAGKDPETGKKLFWKRLDK